MPKLFLYFLLFCSIANAQIPSLSFEHLSTKDGLPSNDIWTINKDKKGFLWIGTGRGICRYDGYNFETFDDAKLGYVSGISNDSNGDIYTSIDIRGLCKIDLKTLKINTLLENNYDDNDLSNDLHEEAFVDHEGQVWVGDNSTVKRYNPATKKLKFYPLSEKSVYQFNSFFEDSKHNLWVVSDLGLFRFDKAKDKVVCVLGNTAIDQKNRIDISLSQAFEDARGNIWLAAFRSGLVKLSPDQKFTFYYKGFENQEIISVIESLDENGKNILFVGSKKGLSIYDPNKNVVIPIPEFFNKGINIKRLFDDKENGILWICTRDGLYKYRYRNLGIRTVSLPANLVSFPVGIIDILQLPNEHYLLGLSHTGAMDWNRTTNSFELLKYPYSTDINRIRHYQNQTFAFTKKGVWLLNKAENRFQEIAFIKKAFGTTNYNDGIIDKQGRIWIANKLEGIKVFDPNSKNEIQLFSENENQKLFVKNYIELILEGLDGKIWVGTCSNGLFFLDEKTASFVNVKSLKINSKTDLGGLCINDMQINPKDSSILLASWGGITKVSKNGKIIEMFSYRNADLLDTYCSNICEDSRGNLWFTTNEDLHIANLKTREISHLTPNEGLSGNYPNGFLYNNKKELFIGFNNLFNILNINNLNAINGKQKLEISSIEIDGKLQKQDFSKEIIVKPNENSITVNFSTLNFEPNSKNIYEYKLEGFNKDWVDLGNKNSVTFANLDPKTYILKVKSGNTSGVWNDKPLSISIIEIPNYNETLWFKLLMSFLAIGLLFGFLRWRLNTINERNQLTLQMTELKLTALQSQMNPHFIFNSLNSIQNYIMQEKPIEAARYLSKFSKLMRRILDQSFNNLTSLSEIVETLRMYMELEAFRFSNEFTWEIQLEDEESIADVKLPPLLLQPYVENAIIHGLMPKDGDKKLLIHLYKKSKELHCVIDDNGIGRGNNLGLEEGHISRGQKLTTDMLATMKQLINIDAQINIIDKIDENGDSLGTKVDLIIPLN